MNSAQVDAWIAKERATRARDAEVARGGPEEFEMRMRILFFEILVQWRVPYVVAWLSRRLDRR